MYGRTPVVITAFKDFLLKQNNTKTYIRVFTTFITFDTERKGCHKKATYFCKSEKANSDEKHNH